MDDKGFIFTADSILMLIPIFIVITAVSHLNMAVPSVSPYYNPQDVMDTLYNSVNCSLPDMADDITYNPTNISAYNSTDLKQVLNSYNCNYNFTYSVNGNVYTLINKGIMSNAKGTVTSSSRIYDNVTFRLYMWKS